LLVFAVEAVADAPGLAAGVDGVRFGGDAGPRLFLASVGSGNALIDSMTALEHNAPPRAFREFGVGLTGFLNGRGVGTLMTTTLPTLLGGEHATAVYLSTITDSIIALRYYDLDSEIRRAVLVLKLRGGAHASEMHEYEITDAGMRLLGPIRGVRGILAGVAEVSSEADGAEGGHAGGRR
jgi:circadian clock protein KaiC